MAENTEVATAPAAAAETKKVKKASSGVKKPKSKPTHPPTAQMVDAAIKTLKERGGSSLLAIKKYLAANYKVDADKLAPFIKKYLKGSVENGKLIQTKGKGAAGSFKLSAAAAKPKKEAKPKVKKPKIAKKVVKKTTTAKKVVGDKKKKSTTAISKKPSAEKKKSEKSAAKAVKKAGTVKTKSPKQKSTKPSKTDAKKPKAPKPKKATAPKKVAAKKPAKK